MIHVMKSQVGAKVNARICCCTSPPVVVPKLCLKFKKFPRHRWTGSQAVTLEMCIQQCHGRTLFRDVAHDVLQTSSCSVKRHGGSTANIQTLSLALDLVSSRNVEELVLVLKKEVQKTLSTTGAAGQDDVGKYRQLLVRTLHQCGVKFPDINPIIMPLLLDLIGVYDFGIERIISEINELDLSQMSQLVPVIHSLLLKIENLEKSVNF